MVGQFSSSFLLNFATELVETLSAGMLSKQFYGEVRAARKSSCSRRTFNGPS